MTDNQILQFKRIMPTEGRDVLNLIQTADSQIVGDMRSNPKHTLTFYNSLLHLTNALIVELHKKPFPDLSPEWYYSFEISNQAAQLYIKHAVDFQEKRDGKECSVSYDCRYRLVNYPVRQYSVDEFAKINKVEAVTVRQWIRRGKLRTAIKNGGEWLIPATAEVPARGVGPVTYYTNGAFIPFPKEFHYIGFNAWTVEINPIKRDTFEINVDGACIDRIKPRYFSDAERIKLESVLLEIPGIANSENIVGIWPSVEEISLVIHVTRSGGMRLPKGWDPELT